MILEKSAVQDFERRLRGGIIQPGDESYDGAPKVRNGSVNRFPALIARCAGVADVIAAVMFARDTDLPVAARSGGNSFAGLSTCESVRAALEQVGIFLGTTRSVGGLLAANREIQGLPKPRRSLLRGLRAAVRWTTA